MQKQQDCSVDSQSTLSGPLRDSLVSIAISAWTIRRNAGQPTSEVENGPFAVHAEAIFDALRQIGVEIEEYTNQPYQPGVNVEILVFEPNSAVKQDTITATIRPAILLHGKIIQRGQVIVSTPSGKETP